MGWMGMIQRIFTPKFFNSIQLRGDAVEIAGGGKIARKNFVDHAVAQPGRWDYGRFASPDRRRE